MRVMIKSDLPPTPDTLHLGSS